jgi:hypothetical protein
MQKSQKPIGKRKKVDKRYKNNRILTPLYVAEYIMPSFVLAMVPRGLQLAKEPSVSVKVYLELCSPVAIRVYFTCDSDLDE